MKRTLELSPTLQEIAKKVQNLIASPVSKELDDFSKLEYQTYIENNEPLIKEELSKIKDIELINTFIKDVPAHELSLDTFPEFVWDELSFAESIYMSTPTYIKFSEKIRATPHILSEALSSAGTPRPSSILEEAIPQSALKSEYKMEVLIGKHDCLIAISAQSLWNDKDFVEKMLFDEDVPNRESIDQYSYIDILRRVPDELIDDDMALRIAEKFQLGYSQLPEKQKLKPELAIIGLNKHIANIEAVPTETLNNPDVTMAAVNATSILDYFQPHPSDDYHPFGHLQKLYESPTFQKLNVLKIEPYRIPGHSVEFKQIIENEYNKLKLALEQELKAKLQEKPTLTPNNQKSNTAFGRGVL